MDPMGYIVFLHRFWGWCVEWYVPCSSGPEYPPTADVAVSASVCALPEIRHETIGSKKACLEDHPS